MSKLTTKPLKGVEQKTWDSLTKYWKSKEFQKKSNIGKNNQNRNGKGMVNHTGSSQTFEVHLKRLEDYTLKNQEALLQLQSEAEASGSSMPNDLLPEKKTTLFKEVAGGEKRWGI